MKTSPLWMLLRSQTQSDPSLMDILITLNSFWIETWNRLGKWILKWIAPNQGYFQKFVDRPYLTFLRILSENQLVDSVSLVLNKEVSFHQFETPLKLIALPPRWSHENPFKYLAPIIWISFHKAYSRVINLQLNLTISLEFDYLSIVTYYIMFEYIYIYIY